MYMRQERILNLNISTYSSRLTLNVNTHYHITVFFINGLSYKSFKKDFTNANCLLHSKFTYSQCHVSSQFGCQPCTQIKVRCHMLNKGLPGCSDLLLPWRLAAKTEVRDAWLCKMHVQQSIMSFHQSAFPLVLWALFGLVALALAGLGHPVAKYS